MFCISKNRYQFPFKKHGGITLKHPSVSVSLGFMGVLYCLFFFVYVEGLVGFYFGAFCILPINIGYTTLFLLVHFNTTLFAYKNIPATFGVELFRLVVHYWISMTAAPMLKNFVLLKRRGNDSIITVIYLKPFVL